MRLSEYLESTKESQRAFGGRLGISQSAVAQMIATRIGAESVLKVCAATGWKVTPHEERPDLYPHPDDGMPRGTGGAPEPERAAA